jgi:hypothetical protein
VPKNAFWHLLSGDEERIRYGLEHYHVNDPGLYNILGHLKSVYSIEGIDMPYTKEDYKKEVLAQFTPRERLEGLPADERLQGLSPRERLQGLSSEQLAALREDLEEEEKRRASDDERSSTP